MAQMVTVNGIGLIYGGREMSTNGGQSANIHSNLCVRRVARPAHLIWKRNIVAPNLKE